MEADSLYDTSKTEKCIEKLFEKRLIKCWFVYMAYVELIVKIFLSRFSRVIFPPPRNKEAEDWNPTVGQQVRDLIAGGRNGERQAAQLLENICPPDFLHKWQLYQNGPSK